MYFLLGSMVLQHPTPLGSKVLQHSALLKVSVFPTPNSAKGLGGDQFLYREIYTYIYIHIFLYIYIYTCMNMLVCIPHVCMYKNHVTLYIDKVDFILGR